MRRYVQLYCEENIWWLAQQPGLAGAEVAIMASPDGPFAIFQQRAGPDPAEPVGWDYHVVLAAAQAGDDARWQVWDLDCVLGAPLPAALWLAASFPEVERWPRRFVPRFRVLPAAQYVSLLCSDRSHMLVAGEYQAPPPCWPVIGRGAPNLMHWVDMNEPEPGTVMDLTAVRKR